MRIGKYIKFIRAVLKTKLTKRRIPLIVILCVTNRCNLNCWYCYGQHQHRNKWVDFTTEELLEIIHTLAKLGTQIIQLQGGEPLLRDDLPVIIKEIKKYGIICDLVTNGVLIPQMIDVVGLLDKICISLDGPLNTNDKNRGQGSHFKIVQGIKAACNLGLPVRISAALTAQTSRDDIDWLLDFSSKYQVTVNFSPSFEFVANIGSKEVKPHIIPDDYLRDLFKYIAMRRKKGAPAQFTDRSYAVASQWPFTYKKRMFYSSDVSKKFEHPKCYHGDCIFFIDGDGSLYPCCNFWGRAKLNIRIQGLKESISNLDRQGCQACYIPAYIDRNLFFNGAFEVWWNYIKQAIKGKV